ncbi:hypothetical protein SESBI_23438 [Sesbania bispinosa]|nr:hypothetical protein SESBI_23438 [Sesbania bispinosa]
MDEIRVCVECYIKGEESNAKKRRATDQTQPYGVNNLMEGRPPRFHKQWPVGKRGIDFRREVRRTNDRRRSIVREIFVSDFVRTLPKQENFG